jgi:hypothetical protein
MMKGVVFTVICFVWIFWCLFSNNPYTRLDRACKPIEKTGNVTTSVALMFSQKAAQATNKTFMHIDYGCEFTLWRLFYEKDWKEQELKDAQAAAASTKRVKGLDDEPANEEKSK